MRRFRTFFKYFKNNKKSFYRYSCLSFLVGILELFGVALTYPFIMKLLAKEPSTNWISSPLVIGIGIILLFLLKNAFMIFYSYLQSKFTKNVEAEVNLAFMKYFLSSSYQITSKIPLSRKETIMGLLIPNVISNYILRLLNLNVNIFIFTLISIFLIIKFPLATIITLFFAALLIGIQNRIFKPKLEAISKKISSASALFNQRGKEVILNIKSVKVSDNEKFFFDNYKSAIYNFFKFGQETLFLNTIPPYITEPFIILLLFILLAIISIENFSEPDKLVASFAVIVSAIFRLSPTISRIQVNLNGISSVLPLVDEFLSLCDKFEISKVKEPEYKEFCKLNEKIELKNINFEYEKGSPVLKDINLEIKKGEFIGIIGHTGSGKSTMVQMLNGLIKPTSGKVLLNGEDIFANPKEIRKVRFQVGMVFQYPEYQLFEETVYKDIAFGPTNMGISGDELDKRVRSAAMFTGLKEELLFKSPFDLSGGEKRRAAIAGVIAMDPEILILDEPTAGLDPMGRDVLLSQITEYHKVRNNTVLLVSHSMEDIARVADRVIVMNKSHLQMFDNTKNIFARGDELAKIGLRIPQITKIMSDINGDSGLFSQGILCVEQAASEIAEVLKRRGKL